MLTRRQMIATTTFAGYAVAVDKVLAQAIKTDTDGLVAGDQVVKIGTYEMPVYEARPASGKDTPIVLVISEIWGVHEYIRDCTRRFAKAGYCAVAPELFKREGGVAQLPNVQDILKIVLAQKREQTLGDLKAAVDWAKKRPNVKAASVGVTGWCWGGSTVYQEAATNHDIKAAVAWYGPPARPYQGASGPVTGFDLANSSAIASMVTPNIPIHAVPSDCSSTMPSGKVVLRSKTPILSSPRNPPSKMLFSSWSLRLTHQVKLSINFWKTRSRKKVSPFPVRSFSCL